MKSSAERDDGPIEGCSLKQRIHKCIRSASIFRWLENGRNVLEFSSEGPQMYEHVRERVGYIRDQLGVSQAQLGQALGLGRVSIARWENGSRIPRRIDLLRLAEALGIEPTWLVDGVGDPPQLDLQMRKRLAVAYEQSRFGRGLPAETPATYLRDRERHGPERSLPSGPELGGDLSMLLIAYEWRVRYMLERSTELPIIPGVGPEIIQAFASGKAVPGIGLLPELAEALGMPQEWFLTGVQAKKPRARLQRTSKPRASE